MKKIEINEEELEMMNYNDIAYLVLDANGKKMKIIDLFHEVGKLLKLEDNSYEEHIADFFELLSTDKRFIMLEEGYWDLSVKHSKGMVNLDDEEDDEEIILEEDESQDGWQDDEETNETDDDVEEDDLSDLVIIDDSEEESNM